MPQEGGCYDLHGNHTEAPSGRVDMEIENARHLTPGEIKEAKLLFKHSMGAEISLCQAVGAAKKMSEPFFI